MLLDEAEQLRVLTDWFLRETRRAIDGDIPLLLGADEMLDDGGGDGGPVEARTIVPPTVEQNEASRDTTACADTIHTLKEFDAMATLVAMPVGPTELGIREWADDLMDLESDNGELSPSDAIEVASIMTCIRGDDLWGSECKCTECHYALQVVCTQVHLESLEYEMKMCSSDARGRSITAEQRRLGREIRQARAQIMVLERYWQTEHE